MPAIPAPAMTTLHTAIEVQLLACMCLRRPPRPGGSVPEPRHPPRRPAESVSRDRPGRARTDHELRRWLRNALVVTAGADPSAGRDPACPSMGMLQPTGPAASSWPGRVTSPEPAKLFAAQRRFPHDLDQSGIVQVSGAANACRSQVTLSSWKTTV